jgi:hypothetical protein
LRLSSAVGGASAATKCLFNDRIDLSLLLETCGLLISLPGGRLRNNKVNIEIAIQKNRKWSYKLVPVQTKRPLIGSTGRACLDLDFTSIPEISMEIESSFLLELKNGKR